MRWRFFLLFFLYPFLLFPQVNEADFLDRQNFDQGNSFNPVGLENMEDHLSQRQNINGLNKKSPRLLPVEKWNALLDYLDRYGPIIHLNELAQIKELSKEDLELLRKHLYVQQKRNLSESLSAIKKTDISYLSIRSFFLTQRKKGFNVSPEDGGFYGSPFGTRIRILRRKYGQYSLGFLLDKDPGEGPSTGVLKEFPMDHNSWHFFFETKGILKKLIIGDFTFSSGEGLIFSPSFYLGKGSEVIYNAKVPESGLRPVLSSSENFGQRGVGIEIGKGNINSTVFYSNRKKNSTLVIQDSRIIGFSSLVSTGLHRSQLELQKKANINESILGGSVTGEFLKKDLKLSLSAKHFNYSIEQIQNLSDPGQTIKDGTLVGLSFSFIRSGNMTFGEIATSQNGGKAIAFGNIFHLDRSWTFGIHFRNYDQGYFNPQGVSFREGNQKNGEQGLYFSIKWAPTKKISIQTFHDQAILRKFSGSFTDKVVSREALVNVNYSPVKRMNFRVLCTYKELEGQLQSETTRSFRSRAIFQREVQFSFRIRSSLETNHSLQKGTGYGYGVSQELILLHRKGSISGMLGFFDTKASGKAVYFFEQNVFREYLIPSYSGVGARYLIQAKMKASDMISLWFRIAHTSFLDRNQVGSSWDEINGNKRTEIKVLLKLNLP